MTKAKSKVRLVKKPDSGDPENYYIVEPEFEDKEKGIRVKCPKCNAEKVLEDTEGWFYIILKHTLCGVCGTKIEMEEE